MPCLPCNMLDLLGATVGRAAATECACKSAISLLVRLGAIGAAKMHAEGAEDHPDKWSAQDWEIHFQEEERLFFPLLPDRVRAQFVAEHATFRDELAKYGKITSLDILRAHSSRENMWADRLLGQSVEPIQQVIAVSGCARVRALAGRVGQEVAVAPDSRIITEADRQNAAIKDEDIDKICLPLTGIPGFSDPETCHANLKKVRDEAKAKIASLEKPLMMTPQSPEEKKPGLRWSSVPVLAAAGAVIALGVGALVWMAKFQSRPGITYFTT
jgi:hypothetical protein